MTSDELWEGIPFAGTQDQMFQLTDAMKRAERQRIELGFVPGLCPRNTEEKFVDRGGE